MKKWFVLSLLFLNIVQAIAVEKMYVCTASNNTYYDILLNMIGSLYRVNFDEIEELSIYDLGLDPEQKEELSRIQKVKLYEVERVNPSILTPFATRPNNQKLVPGWYSWKPVVIKDSLERFPYVLWLDAGLTIMRPLNTVFDHIIEHGYFFVDSDDWIRLMTKKSILEKFNVMSDSKRWILNEQGLTTNIMGISKDRLYDNFIVPVYEMAADITHFEDDGSCLEGFGRLRPEQSIYSIIACNLGLRVFKKPNISLRVNGRLIPIVITTKSHFNVNDPATILNTRSSIPHLNYFKSYIRYD